MLILASLSCLFKNLGDTELVTTVYWSGYTKAGCAGQYSNCFEQEDDLTDDFEFDVIKNKAGGACVAFLRTLNGLTAKAVTCDSKAFLACQTFQETVTYDKVNAKFLLSKHCFHSSES